ncbi:hypothetical protein [Desulfoluna spongiiphila]|nr:hypothetical protein [Desulfoluna spongiiphila]
MKYPGSGKEGFGKWAGRLGLVVNRETRKKSWMCWFMTASGVAFILPLFGLSYWIAVVACPIAIFCVLTMTTGLDDLKMKKTGSVVRKGLALSAALVFGFTVWEGRDLVSVGFGVNYKAIYWRHKEVAIWQHTHNANVPKVGEMATDFEVSDYTGTKSIRLSDFRGKRSVVLLFGSCT